MKVKFRERWWRRRRRRRTEPKTRPGIACKVSNTGTPPASPR